MDFENLHSQIKIVKAKSVQRKLAGLRWRRIFFSENVTDDEMLVYYQETANKTRFNTKDARSIFIIRITTVAFVGIQLKI